jgi:hypothetical protein
MVRIIMRIIIHHPLPFSSDCLINFRIRFMASLSFESVWSTPRSKSSSILREVTLVASGPYIGDEHTRCARQSPGPLTRLVEQGYSMFPRLNPLFGLVHESSSLVMLMLTYHYCNAAHLLLLPCPFSLVVFGQGPSLRIRRMGSRRWQWRGRGYFCSHVLDLHRVQWLITALLGERNETHINLLPNVADISSSFLDLHVVQTEHSCVGGLDDSKKPSINREVR